MTDVTFHNSGPGILDIRIIPTRDELGKEAFTLEITFEEHSGIPGDRLQIENLTVADFLQIHSTIEGELM